MHLSFRSCCVWAGCGLLIVSNGSQALADDELGYSTIRPLAATEPVGKLAAPPVTPPAVPPAASQTITPQPKAVSAPAFPRPGVPSPIYTRPLIEPQVTNQTRQALAFYGGYAARATLSQQPRRAPIQPAPSQPARQQFKPFQTVYRDPTVSPYLNLYRSELDSDSAPNYFAFVRPQMEQIDANRKQQREIQHLRGQLQRVSSTVAGPQYQSSGTPGTGTTARYMDTAQFYGGWRR